MLLNKIFFLFAFFISVASFAMDCDLAKAINHPSLASNSEFWEKLSAINPKDDFAIRKLITSYSLEALSPVQSVQAVARVALVSVETSRKAEKEIGKLTKINTKHFDEFLKVLDEQGLRGFLQNPNKWSLERLVQYGDRAHSVRLDGGYRVLFNVEKDGSILVREVNNKIGH